MNDKELIWEAYSNRTIDFHSFTPSQLERYETNLYNKLIKMTRDRLQNWFDEAIQIRSDYDTDYSYKVKMAVYDNVLETHRDNKKLYFRIAEEAQKLGEQVRDEASKKFVDEIYKVLSAAGDQAQEFYTQADPAIFTQAINNLKNSIRTIQNPKARTFYDRMLRA